MKYCIYCGNKIEGSSKFCTACGKELVDDYPTKNESKANNKTIQLVAYIIMIVSLVLYALLLIPLIWRIPMLLKYKRHMDNGEPLSTAYKVCTLIFVDIIAGVLIFLEDKIN